MHAFDKCQLIFFGLLMEALTRMNLHHLIIFVKNPALGKVKTRLAMDVGDETALRVYLKLLELTRNAASAVNCTRNVFYSDEVVSDEWDDDVYNKFVQQGNDLGERMNNAFEQIFALGAQKAVIIGSDCPEIHPEIISTAFEQLDDHDVVIGPASDGGYYLLGMKAMHRSLFENMEWSTERVFSETMERIDRAELSVSTLPVLTDLDTVRELPLLNMER